MQQQWYLSKKGEQNLARCRQRAKQHTFYSLFSFQGMDYGLDIGRSLDVVRSHGLDFWRSDDGRHCRHS